MITGPRSYLKRLSYIIKNNDSVLFKYLSRILIALSVLLNVILGGSSNQTFSARQHSWRRDDKANVCSIVDLVFFFDPEHCRKSWAYWRLRKTMRTEAEEAIEILRETREGL